MKQKSREDRTVRDLEARGERLRALDGALAALKGGLRGTWSADGTCTGYPEASCSPGPLKT